MDPGVWMVGGSGPRAEHGIALMFVLAGALYMLAILVIPLHPRIWRLSELGITGCTS